MLYKPSFCCHCGEKIDKADWKFLSSRRFCDVCKEENKGFELLARLAVAGALLLPVAVVGSLLATGKDETVQTVSSVQAGRKPASLQVNREIHSALGNSESVNNRDIAGSRAVQETRTAEIGKQPQNPKIALEGEIFFCGAVTKKGTACTRKVKIKGNCWQHSARSVSMAVGRPAAIN